MIPSLATAWWVTRWLARSVAMLSMTAFTALALAMGAGAAAVPAAASPVPDTAVAPARVTLGADVTARSGVERVDLALLGQQTTTSGEVSAADADDSVVPVTGSGTEPAGAVPAAPVGERAPPRR